MKKTNVPMRSVSYPLVSGQRQAHLLVMLPGAQEEPEDFERQGFVAMVRQHNIAVDVLAVDSHMGYFTESQIAQRLRLDVIEPARRAGYKTIWLMGISLGGFAAFLLSEKHQHQFQGIVALAPYVGTRAISGAVKAAGGLRTWQAPAAHTLAANDWENPLWATLQRLAAAEGARQANRLPAQLWLGYGRSDRFAPALDLINEALPKGQSLVVDGGHDWPAWKALWQQFLVQHGDWLVR